MPSKIMDYIISQKRSHDNYKIIVDLLEVWQENPDSFENVNSASKTIKKIFKKHDINQKYTDERIKNVEYE